MAPRLHRQTRRYRRQHPLDYSFFGHVDVQRDGLSFNKNVLVAEARFESDLFRMGPRHVSTSNRGGIPPGICRTSFACGSAGLGMVTSTYVGHPF